MLKLIFINNNKKSMIYINSENIENKIFIQNNCINMLNKNFINKE